jgi:integrase
MAKQTKNQVKNGIVFSGKSWSYVIRVPDPITGKTKPAWFGGFDTAINAKLARDKARVAVGQRDYIAPTKLTVGEYLTAWIDAHARKIKPTTLNRYRELIKDYLVPRLGSIKLQELKPLHVEQFYNSMAEQVGVAGKHLAPRTARQAGAILKTALKQAVEVENLITINPATRVKLPKSNSVTPTPFNFSELKQFLDVARSHRLYFYFRLSAYTGARRGELLALKWADFDGKTINLTKNRTSIGNEVIEQNTTKGGNNGQRRVPLDNETIEQFKEHRTKQLNEASKLMKLGAWNNTGYVFTQENGLPLYTNTVSDLYRKLIKKAGLRHNRLHDLRHAHATELLRLGEPLHVVANRLGHRDAMVTATIYAHVSSEQAETASERFASASREVI